MEGGIDDVGLGVLFGLEGYQYELVGILMHAEHLEAVQGVGPHTISVPRICPADDIDTADFSNAVPDEIFEKIVSVIRIAVPYTGMIVSTRGPGKQSCSLGFHRLAVAQEQVLEDIQYRNGMTVQPSLM